MAGLDGIAALGHAMRAALGPDADLCMALEDWRKGYYQLRVRQDSSRYLCATALGPEFGVRISKPECIMFGAANAPAQFCRVNAAVLQIVAFYFATPAIPHVDDDIIIETIGAVASARQASVLVHDLREFQLSPERVVPRIDSGPRGAWNRRASRDSLWCRVGLGNHSQGPSAWHPCACSPANLQIFFEKWIDAVA